MSVSTNQNRFSQLGDGLNTAFNFPSYFKAKTDILVLVTDDQGNVSTKVLDVDYSIVGAVTAGFGYVNGAIINFNVAPADTDTVILISDPNQLQNTVLPANSIYPPQKIESTFDAIVLMLQRIASVLFSRAVVLKDGMIDAFDPTLPIDIASVANRGRVVITDPDGGNVFKMGPSADEIENAQDYATQAAASAAAAAASETTAIEASVLANEAAADAAANLEAVQAFATLPVLVDTSVGSVAANLPAVVTGTPKMVTYINKSFNSGNDLTLTPTGVATSVMGEANIAVGSGEVVQLWFDGATTWWKLN